jgi:hypothetical protein
MVRFLPRAGFPFPAVPHDADVNIVGKLLREPEKRLGLCSIHNNELHGTFQNASRAPRAQRGVKVHKCNNLQVSRRESALKIRVRDWHIFDD